MIDILELLIEEQDVPEQVELLRQGRDALVARCEAFGDLEYPVECTPALAWAALRESIRQEGYYLSVKELQVLLPTSDTLVDVYRYEEGGDAGAALVHIEQPSYYQFLPNAQQVKIVLDERGDTDGCRGGHFSRLWSSIDWDAQPLWPSLDVDSDSGSNGLFSTEGEDSESSDADENNNPKRVDTPPLDDEDLLDPTVEDSGSKPEALRPEKEPNYEDLDELSDISDCSDIFHTDVLPEGEAAGGLRNWQTTEDKQMALIDVVASRMRLHPLMPAASRDGATAYNDMESCVRLPLLHCAFKGCSWCKNYDELPSTIYHWDLEWALYLHLYEEHSGRSSAAPCGTCGSGTLPPSASSTSADAMKEVFDYVRARRVEQHGDTTRIDFLRVISYYLAAVCQQEREHMPLIGPTNDRRMLAYVAKLADSKNVVSRMCFCCDQIHTDLACYSRHMTKAWPKLGADTDVSNDIQLYKVGELLRYFESDPAGFMMSFSLGKFRTQYAAGNDGENAFAHCKDLDDGIGDWQCMLKDMPGEKDFWALCNPEDVERCNSCVGSNNPKSLCRNCKVPLCHVCIRVMRGGGKGGIPLSLCNDNFWTHTCELLYKYDVTWLEMAVASPCWTLMLVYYVEGDRGHLINEKVGGQQWRTKVKGGACSFQMPWEDIVKDLQRNINDNGLTEIPRSAECIKYMLRVHLKVGKIDFSRKLKQLHVRPFIVLQLLYYLIDQNHEVFRGKGAAIELKAKMRAAVEREYPETEPDVPESQRQGHIPESLLEMSDVRGLIFM